MSWSCLDCAKKGEDQRLAFEHHSFTGHRVRPVLLPEEEITDDEAAKLADAFGLEDAVTDALIAAEDIARRCNEPALAETLARLQMLWAIGGIKATLALLDQARDSVLAALREVTDEVQT